jgi:hypothetical protein
MERKEEAAPVLEKEEATRGRTYVGEEEVAGGV